MTEQSSASGVPDRCRIIREHFGLAARAMSLHIGISQNNWFQYELGRKEPSMSTLRRLAELGINTDWLVTGRGSMFASDRTSESGRTGDGFARLLTALDVVLKEYGVERLDLWSRTVSVLSRVPQGMPLAELAQQMGVAPDSTLLDSELCLLQKEGVIVLSKGVYRLIRASYDFNASATELQALLVTRDLLGTIVPALQTSLKNGKLLRTTDVIVSGKVLERLHDLVVSVRQIANEPDTSVNRAEARTLRLVLAYSMTP